MTSSNYYRMINFVDECETQRLGLVEVTDHRKNIRLDFYTVHISCLQRSPIVLIVVLNLLQYCRLHDIFLKYAFKSLLIQKSSVSPFYVKNDYMPNFTGNYFNISLEDSLFNFTNGSDFQTYDETAYKLKHPAIAAVLAMFSFITISGNLLVIVAVTRELYLRTVTNYFIVSLAVADIMVGGLVMPFSISHEMTNQVWLYGPEWCDLWHSFDVLASTASILNLCVISLDRYWAITDPIAYPSKMSPCKVWILITFVWVCSAGISFPAIAWWKSVTPSDLPDYMCLFTEDSAYLIFSSFISFYCPTLVMMFVYCRIYQAASAQSKSLKAGAKILTSSNGLSGHGETMTLRIHRGGMNKRHSEELHSPYDKSASESETENSSTYMIRRSSTNHDVENRTGRLITKRFRNFAISKKLSKFAREQKAAKTLGIVVGVFIICWLPFFVTNVLIGICHSECVSNPEILFPVVTWLGYINSGMNPIIYALSMRDFRRAFGKVLFSCCPYYKNLQRRKQYNASSLSTSSFTVLSADRGATIRI